VPLTPLYLFASVEAAFFSTHRGALGTDWLSTTPALGSEDLVSSALADVLGGLD